MDRRVKECTLLLWTSSDREPRTPRKLWWTSGADASSILSGDGENLHLRAASHFQLGGVRTGQIQLHYALGDMKNIQKPLVDISKDWRQIIDIIES
eukprot:XP_014007986.1 PREDICTED: exocyst complex component 3-like [Salmo salar]